MCEVGRCRRDKLEPVFADLIAKDIDPIFGESWRAEFKAAPSMSGSRRPFGEQNAMAATNLRLMRRRRAAARRETRRAQLSSMPV